MNQIFTKTQFLLISGFTKLISCVSGLLKKLYQSCSVIFSLFPFSACFSLSGQHLRPQDFQWRTNYKIELPHMPLLNHRCKVEQRHVCWKRQKPLSQWWIQRLDFWWPPKTSYHKSQKLVIEFAQTFFIIKKGL